MGTAHRGRSLPEPGASRNAKATLTMGGQVRAGRGFAGRLQERRKTNRLATLVRNRAGRLARVGPLHSALGLGR